MDSAAEQTVRARRHPEPPADLTFPARPGEIGDYRTDLERLRFSPYFGRLSAVTQVVPQSGVGPVMHNRLTHSLKVSAVARTIAAHLAARQAAHLDFAAGRAAADDPVGAALVRLGGCDTVVAQAAAHAHDLGHPPFGHLGERILDRVARHRLGLAEGFEGNAQTFRILTRLDTLGRATPGLNLTAAVRASVLKYPWTRAEWKGIGLDAQPLAERPRGVGAQPAAGAEKFSAYALEAEEMAEVRAAHTAIGTGRQTLDCAIMDLADDIAYAVHDLDDFVRAGVLQHAAVAGELHAWLGEPGALSREEPGALEARWRSPGASLELLWRRLAHKDPWVADREVFAEAVVRVSAELADELLTRPYDGGVDSERAVSAFTNGWIDRLRSAIVVDPDPHVRSGHIRLDQRAWHEVAVLKFVHARFVLDLPELAQSQRGQARVIEELVTAFESWLGDPHDRSRAPRRLLEWVEESTEETFALAARAPRLLTGDTDEPGLRRQGRARAILDYVSSLTDQQALTTHASLTGQVPLTAR
ncbi:deoxyguanosinetriphosphate triphosphohydrolase family protein [Brevibacterium album]|uniref:deoxyguanosinetriphosphate triphosphohydrolase family protein n=1 Tax=Brevibacterium album TaxID=417948 RepID=UPI0004003971|nr:dNTP triphosphohydrolase [Brevibacterium album]